MAVMRNILSIAVASVASPCSCRFVLLLGINWVSLSYRWTTIDSNTNKDHRVVSHEMRFSPEEVPCPCAMVRTGLKEVLRVSGSRSSE